MNGSKLIKTAQIAFFTSDKYSAEYEVFLK
jgi:hypothetical protein